MGKIRSSLVEADQPDLRAKYEEIYSPDSNVWMYKKSHGVHSVIITLLRPVLDDAMVLDVGCGAGRLSLMCAARARRVHGIDFATGAVRLAELNARACDVRNVAFQVGELETYKPVERHGVATLIGFLEHVDDPVRTLRAVNGVLDVGAVAVVSCPNFLNFRGHTYMTLLTLLGLPMSLADVRQVSYGDVQEWSQASGFQLERAVGAIYRFAWDEKSVADMVKRVPAAIEDAELPPMTLDYRRYNTWLQSQVDVNRRYLAALEQQGVLKRIRREVKLVPRQVEGVDADLSAKLREYLDEDIDSDPFYSDVDPFCYQGGECIYLLRKVGDAAG